MSRPLAAWLHVLVVAMFLGLFPGWGMAQVEQFSPQGEVKGIRQVTARFATPMVPFGDPRLVEPFAISCDEPGTGRWADSRNWVFDFERDLPAGVRCEFSVRDGLADLAGAVVPAAAFAFSTGGPAITESMPWEGDEGIDEDQVFVLALDAKATGASVEKFAWCDVAGRAERVPVRLVSGKDRKGILDRRREFVSRVARAYLSGPALEAFERSPDPDALPIVLLACQGRLPNQAEVRLVWGAGIETSSGVATKQDQILPFRVREAFMANFSCRRTHAQSQCIPVLPMSLQFTAPVAVALAEQIRLAMPGGASLPPIIAESERKEGFVSSVAFPSPLPESATFTITLPDGLVDDAGRRLSNARRFPLQVRTDPAPPLAKFAARFGILELNADPALPLTVRNVEKPLTGRQASRGAADRLAARMLRVQSPRDVLHWMRRLNAAEARWEEGGYVSRSVFEPGDTTTPLSVPRPGDAKDFEVIGIPFKAPGLYVVEVVSPKLGAALLKDAQPYYVSAAALVTNLAVHFKWGRESSLVWVTTLDKGAPARGASVAVMDCRGRVLAEGRTDRQGVLRVAKPLPSRDSLPGCTAQWDRQLFVTARMGDDASFVFSDWNDGISTWRFNLRRGGYEGQDSVTTVFDRTLVRAGDTVGMKHFARRRTTRGFAFVPAKELPARAVVRHLGTNQRWELPLAWKNGSAETSFAVPKDAKLGEYEVVLSPVPKRNDDAYVPGRVSGTFRVEAFRVPVLRAEVAMPSQPLVATDRVEVGVQLSYLSGGGAGGQGVKVRALTRPRATFFPDYEGVSFANGDVVEGRRDGRSGGQVDDEGNPVEGATGEGGADTVRALRTEAVTLDAGGGGRVTLEGWPASAEPRELVAEMEYADPNGQILTRSARATLWPSALVLGIRPEGWALSRDKVKIQVVALDTAGHPQAGVRVVVDLFQREAWSHRKRLVGGFYAYEYGDEVRRIGPFCEGESDERGIVHCEAPVGVSGNLILRAATWDAEGRASVANGEVWVAGSDDWWFDVANDDRMDVLPERKRYEPGETAVVQVRSPFRRGTALVTVEREGVIDAFVTTLSGKAPVVKVPIRGHYAPNAFISVFEVRGRAAGVQPTALVDLGKPAFRMGVAEVKVGWQAHELAVRVATDRPVYPIRDRATVTIDVTRADGKALPAGAEVAVAAVDEALLELMPNDSWRLLERMMQPRGIEVDTATAAMQVVGKRHFGKKALPAGGGGGQQSARELFDTLLAWRPRVKLDGRGRATLDIPLNDSLTSFRIVAVASAGAGLFGTGSASVRTSQDVQILSGLPPLVRERDRLAATFTVRNASTAPLDLEVAPALSSEPPGARGLPALAPQVVSLAAGEARNVTWDLAVPAGVTALRWDVSAGVRDSNDPGRRDRVKLNQTVAEAVPVRVLQATLLQLDRKAGVEVAPPAGALPGRGEVAVLLRDRLAGEMPAVTEYMTRYPYSCLEQKVSQAVALRDQKAWAALMTALPTYLDRDGLAKYFPLLREGSDSLTAYLLAVADEAGWKIPEPALTRMTEGLLGFVDGRVVRHGSLPTADLTVRKVAALDALTRHVRDIDAGSVSTFLVEPNLWPTSAVIDWHGVARRWQDLPDRERQIEATEQILRSRLQFKGTTMGFSTERADYLWWLMVSGDVNANRILLALMDAPAWRADLPRLVRGALGRQHAGRWNTTVANAWGVLAMDRFARTFEAESVTGKTTATLGETHRALAWKPGATGGRLSLPWPRGTQTLALAQEGTGRPWVTVQSRAAVPLAAPLESGYRIRKTVAAVEGSGERWRRGDVMRVRLDIDAQADMTWVVVDDPVPAGATILGSGLGGDSAMLTAGEDPAGRAWPAFQERAAGAFRAYYRYVPKGRFTIEYTLRLDNPGTFQLPPTRVEAMYSPEMFGERPNDPVTIGAR